MKVDEGSMKVDGSMKHLFFLKKIKLNDGSSRIKTKIKNEMETKVETGTKGANKNKDGYGEIIPILFGSRRQQ